MLVAAVVMSSMLGYHFQRTNLDDIIGTSNRYSTVDSVDNGLEALVRKTMPLTNASRPETKYIVYDCSEAHGGACGGWSDRMAGIMTTFILSILAKRRFAINFDTPCLLQDYVIPAHFDWRYNSTVLLNKTSPFHMFKNLLFINTGITKYMFKGDDCNDCFKDDVVFFRVNWDFINHFRKRPNIGNDIPWITRYHQADIYKHVFTFLFKPSPVTIREFNNQYKTQRKRNKIACAHVRIGRNPNMPRDHSRHQLPLDSLWTFFDTLNKDEYDLFVASDTDSVKASAKERFPKRMIDTAGNITHIDKPGINDPREGFLKQLLDFYILIDCDILIISSNGGFGILVALLRNIESGLYCWQGRYFIPCSRYTVGDIFPNGKFSTRTLQ
ncbi:hypothetical protein KP79_PYT24381 [Mizuhopecten yessoensis]|uniref:Alpha-(1,6)-fucosyltransferase n=1 Tax=Mizuhopecten yessoensis TaxID=6573 RepID=A0A210QS68_MIZYE|nr:hypothetical protein KP79_PYT24381 [Mizuhopecten yessoensis]